MTLTAGFVVPSILPTLDSANDSQQAQAPCGGAGGGAGPIFDVLSTGYPEKRIHLVEGDVLETISAQAPDRIALLRLDTDWHASTKHELAHLVPRVAPNGILIVDDYGHWPGARRAVDELLAGFGRPVFLARTDYTGRIAVLA